MILTGRMQKYQHCHLVKLVNMNILRLKKYLQFTYSPLGKAFEKNKTKKTE